MRIYPTIEEFEKKEDPVKEHILALARYFDKTLDDNWEIFLRPFMNSEQPDLVLLHNSVGVIFFHIYDKKLNEHKVTYKKSVSDRGTFISKSIIQKINNNFIEIYYPYTILRSLSENLINIYVPSLSYKINENKAVKCVVKRCIYLPNILEPDARKIFTEADDPDFYFLTKSDLNSQGLNIFISSIIKDQKYYLEKFWYDEIKYWLKPPFHNAESDFNYKFNPQQRRYAYHRSKIHQRFRGIAGSGKSFVLAHRAADIASQNLKVLLLTYNITLINYIHYFLRNVKFKYALENITVTNYHHFCSIYFNENYEKWPKESDERKMFDKVVPEKVIDMMDKNLNKLKRHYDAILIDEVQDFLPIWIDSITKFLTDNDEIVVVGDDDQDIFGRGTKALAAIKKGFSGPWARMNITYRFQSNLLAEATRFKLSYLSKSDNDEEEDGDDEIMTVVTSKPIDGEKLFWSNLDKHDPSIILKVYNYFISNQYADNQQIIILVPDFSTGKNVIKSFKIKGIKCVGIFNERGEKVTFKYADPRLKVCTIQSFKGWEYHSLIVYTPDDEYKQTSNIYKLIYISLTRAKNNLYVINRHSIFNEFPNNNWKIIEASDLK